MVIHKDICPECESGALIFYTCSDGDTIVLLCDECNAVYWNALAVSSPAAAYPDSETGYLSGETGLRLRGGLAGYATKEAVLASGTASAIGAEVP